MITAEQVRQAMRRKELNQAQIARMSKVSQSIISTWLSGKAEPSDISKTRIALALDIMEPGEANDQQIGAAIAQEPEEPAEVPALEPLDQEAAAPVAEPGNDYSLMTDEEAAAEEIMDALGMAEPDPVEDIEPDPLPEIEIIPHPETTPSPEPTRSITDSLFELLMSPDVILAPKEMTMTVNLRGFASDDLAALLWDIDALKGMQARDAISRYAFDTACASLLDIYKTKGAGE